MANITYEVLEKLGVLSESPRGWTKELRLIDWNNRGPRYDLREWSPGDKKASRGITMSLKEMRILQEVMSETELPEDEEYGDDEAEAVDANEAFGESGGKYAPAGKKPLRRRGAEKGAPGEREKAG